MSDRLFSDPKYYIEVQKLKLLLALAGVFWIIVTNQPVYQLVKNIIRRGF
ncbi:MAG: hypothetical protein JEZ11_13155 [Desulfobacterales bacterium]|nr:hypothetical protein [Desulfobacterales bacterium]